MSAQPVGRFCAGLGLHGMGVKQVEEDLQDLKAAFDAEPDDLEVARTYAEALAKSGHFEESLDCWNRIEELIPEDPEPAIMIAKLTIAKNRYQAVHGAFVEEPVKENNKPVDKGSDGHKVVDTRYLYRRSKPKGAIKQRTIELTEWQKLERAIDNNPANVKLYTELAELYLEAGRDYDAERVLTKGINATDDHAEIRASWEDITLYRSEKKLDVAQKCASVENTPAAKAAFKEAQCNHQQLVLDIFNSRCERDPENTAIRYEFGMHLKKAGHFRTAFARFKEALGDPEYKSAANLEIGECMQRFQKYPEALQFYRQAVETATEMEQVENRKLALYRAGVLASGIKLQDAARRYLSELVELDPDYKDAALRLSEI